MYVPSCLLFGSAANVNAPPSRRVTLRGSRNEDYGCEFLSSIARRWKVTMLPASRYIRVVHYNKHGIFSASGQPYHTAIYTCGSQDSAHSSKLHSVHYNGHALIVLVICLAEFNCGDQIGPESVLVGSFGDVTFDSGERSV